jgi:hypothetical protein
MSEQNPWVVVATFAEALSPVLQPAADAVAQVCHAVVDADQKLEMKRLLPPSE